MSPATRQVGPPRTSPAPARDPAAAVPMGASATALDRRRYLRVVRFLVGVFVHLCFWDACLRRLWPSLARRNADLRWRGLARRYRRLAVSQGGLLIKLGQFMSIRVDVLPGAVTAELAGLQDEVPPEAYAAICAEIEDAFGEAAATVFARIDRQPLGAASLAQVHRALLPDGRPAVVKVQRPGIGRLVETDLAAFRLGVRAFRRLGWVRRRADLDRIYDEFARTCRAELDFVAEGHHAETFAQMFRDDPRVVVPRVFWSHVRRHVLTLAEIEGLKVTDLAALSGAGIDRRAVAARLVDVYFQQIFVHNFVHADPHPGNLFVVPDGPDGAGARFRLAFVDFGMVAVVPERVRAALRDYLVGFATRDVARIVRAYAAADLLLPDADLRRIEQAQAALFDRFWGVRMGDLQHLALGEARGLVADFGDLLREMPFQLPSDLLFVGRAVGILSGLATMLDPDFDIWTTVAPFARTLTAGDSADAVGAEAVHSPLEAPWRVVEERIRALARLASPLEAPVASLLAVPGGMERVLRTAADGGLTLRHELGPELRDNVERWRSLGRTLIWALVVTALVLGGAIIRLAEGPSLLSNVLLAGAALALVAVMAHMH